MIRSVVRMKGKEKYLVNWCLSYLRMHGYFAWRQNTGGTKFKNKNGSERYVSFGIKGAGDVTGLMKDGRRLEVECKAQGGAQSADQKTFEQRILASGGVYILVFTPEEFVAKLTAAGMR